MINEEIRALGLMVRTGDSHSMLIRGGFLRQVSLPLLVEKEGSKRNFQGAFWPFSVLAFGSSGSGKD